MKTTLLTLVVLLTTTLSIFSQDNMDKIIHVWGNVLQWKQSPLLVDHEGNIYLTGTFHDTIFFGSEDNFLVADDSSDSYLAKVYPDGTLAWKHAVSGFDHEYILDIEVDQEGFIYFIGDFGGTLMIDTACILAEGQNDSYICKMDTDGDLVKLVSDKDLHLHKTAMDGNGQIYLIGFSKDNQVLNSPFEPSGRDSHGYGAFAAKLNSDFTADWVISVCDSGSLQQPEGSGNGAVASDPFNNIYILGGVNNDTIIYLSKFDPNGNILWFRIMSTMDIHGISDLFIDQNNYIYAVGDGVISKFTNNGDIIWTKNPASRFWKYEVDQNGYTYLIYFKTWGTLDGFMVLDPDGEIVFEFEFDKVEFNQLAMDDEGNVYLNGQFVEEISINGETLYLKSGENLIMMQLKSEDMIGSLFDESIIPDRDYSLYPNPTKDILIIGTNTVNYYSIEITSMNGQLIYKREMEGPTHQLDISSFPKGVYIITIKFRDFVRMDKIIKL